ncbi:hypothetical protein VNO77_15352 [Canavalia gladiata]|uniref:Uncharacterized protein n=1 Tax=Canavalia gladiata TaxID=3824 RepID=A0AAN9M480_CANGL
MYLLSNPKVPPSTPTRHIIEECHLLILSTKSSPRREETSMKLFSNLTNRGGELCLDFTIWMEIIRMEPVFPRTDHASATTSAQNGEILTISEYELQVLALLTSQETGTEVYMYNSVKGSNTEWRLALH